ncbi:MAG: c-type cytochrome domain-containing protein, partial [Planctomycetota bacterium]|nr:c-type cytochrome domain-containing protein [Planctomycetota bacterium]
MLVLCSAIPASEARVQEIDFNRDIRPLLSNNCFFCHGPDEEHREADLRLDQEKAAKEGAIEPGD